jgi:hypothetical protein
MGVPNFSCLDVPNFLGVSNWFPLRAMGFLNSLGVPNLLPNILLREDSVPDLRPGVLKCGCPEIFNDLLADPHETNNPVHSVR